MWLISVCVSAQVVSFPTGVLINVSVSSAVNSQLFLLQRQYILMCITVYPANDDHSQMWRSNKYKSLRLLGLYVQGILPNTNINWDISSLNRINTFPGKKQPSVPNCMLYLLFWTHNKQQAERRPSDPDWLSRRGKIISFNWKTTRGWTGGGALLVKVGGVLADGMGNCSSHMPYPYMTTGLGQWALANWLVPLTVLVHI